MATLADEEVRRSELASYIDGVFRLDDIGYKSELIDLILSQSDCLSQASFYSRRLVHEGDIDTSFFLHDLLPEFDSITRVLVDIVNTHENTPCSTPSCPLHQGAKERLLSTQIIRWPVAAFEASAVDTDSGSPKIFLSANVEIWSSIVSHTIASAILSPMDNAGELSQIGIDLKISEEFPARLNSIGSTNCLFDFMLWDITDSRRVVPFSFLRKNALNTNPIFRLVSDIVRRGFIAFIFAHEITHIAHNDCAWIDPDEFMKDIVDHGLRMSSGRHNYFSTALNQIKDLYGWGQEKVPLHCLLNFTRYQAREARADYFAFRVIDYYLRDVEANKNQSDAERQMYCKLFLLGACSVFPFIFFWENFSRFFDKPQWPKDPLQTTHLWARDLLIGLDHPHPRLRSELVQASIFNLPDRLPYAEAKQLCDFHNLVCAIFSVSLDQFSKRADTRAIFEAIANKELVRAKKWTRDLSDVDGLGLRERSVKKLKEEILRCNGKGALDLSGVD